MLSIGGRDPVCIYTKIMTKILTRQQVNKFYKEAVCKFTQMIYPCNFTSVPIFVLLWSIACAVCICTQIRETGGDFIRSMLVMKLSL